MLFRLKKLKKPARVHLALFSFLFRPGTPDHSLSLLKVEKVRPGYKCLFLFFLTAFICLFYFGLMIIDTASGRFGDHFFQMAKGHTIQYKKRLPDYKCKTSPSYLQLAYRDLFSKALKGLHFHNRTEMYMAIRSYIKTHKPT